MITEIRNTCLQTIQKILLHLSQMNQMMLPAYPKKFHNKMQSIQNQVELLKSNFTLIVAKVLRLEGKCSDKESHAHHVETKYRAKYEQMSQKFRVLELRHEKATKQLNFIKFSNKNLRDEVLSFQKKSQQYQNCRNVLSNIQTLISENTENLKSKIGNIIRNNPICQKQNPPSFHQNPQSEFLAGLTESQQFFSAQKQKLNKNQNSHHRVLFSSSDLSQETSPQIFQTRKKKLIKETLEPFPNERKKKQELSKLIEQQSRLAKIKERYLSTDIV